MFWHSELKPMINHNYHMWETRGFRYALHLSLSMQQLKFNFFFLVLRIFNKAFKEILTAYHKPIKLLHLLHTYFERCFIFLTNPKQTSNTSSTFQLCQVICKNKSNMITPKENYFNHAFLTIIGAEELSAVLKLQMDEQSISAFVENRFHVKKPVFRPQCN